MDTTRIDIVVERSLLQAVHKACRANDTTLSRVVRMALHAFLDQHREPELFRSHDHRKSKVSKLAEGRALSGLDEMIKRGPRL